MAEIETQENYGIDLPDDKIMSERFRYSVRYWRNRNKFIKDVRDAIEGLNKIESPVSAQYKVKVLHMFILASLHNEKLSRFLARPRIQSIPDEDYDDDALARSTKIETWVNTAWYEMERRGGGDTWTRACSDSILLDTGVTMTLRATNPFWKELVAADKDAIASGKPNETYPFGSDKRMSYKKEHGTPIKKVYIPLENWYPQFDGDTLVGAFHLETRSLVAVLSNPLFKGDEEGAKIISEIRSRGTLGPDGGLGTEVNIVHFVNNKYHAYYLLDRPQNATNAAWPRVTTTGYLNKGDLKLLYKYEHGIPRSLYNYWGGRFGGWITSTNRIEGVGKALLELCQAADEIVSQVLTNVRAKYWPSLNFVLDPEQRGFGAAGGKPTPPVVKEGEPIVTFKGEEIKPIFVPEEDPMAMWLFDQINAAIGKLGGSPVLFGGRLEGVDTGYAQAVQQTAAESIDNKLEQHIQMGAEIEALLLLLHVRAIGEEVCAHYVQTTALGTKKGRYISISPDDTEPMPRFDARVRAQRPVDFIGALRAAREASDDREGKGPLYSDQTIRSDILSMDAPDVEYNKILIEAMKREMINNGTIAAKIGERVNMKLAQQGVPEMTPEMLQKVDPALAATLAQGQEAMAQGGGTDPSLIAGLAEQGGLGLPPGPAPGNPEPFNRMGEAVEMNMETGASI